jgi:long-chain acyl-CoA synthetase
MKVVNRLFDILPYHAENYNPKPDVLASKEMGAWITYSIQEYRKLADAISYALLDMGISKGDKVGTIMPGRPEWNIIDMGILQAGAIHVPIYPTIKESDYRYILEHSEVKFLFISGPDIFRKIEHIIPEMKTLMGVSTIKEIAGLTLFADVIAKGNKAIDAEKVAKPVSKSINDNGDIETQLDRIKKTINEHDLATIIYTSGTTGNPKGVMLTHHNIISNFKAVEHIPPVGQEGKALSYLPLCHIYERMMNYLFQYLGISVYYAESIAMIAENIREVKPDIVTTVPRLLEKIYDKIIQNGRKLTGIKKFIFFRSVALGNHFKEDGRNSFIYKLEMKVLDKLVFSKWRAALGNNLKVVVSGGAALQPRLSRIFWAAGVPVIEGYGLTETSPVIAVNEFGFQGTRFGSVGRPLKHTRVMIAQDGEICAKGPGLMLGYFKEPELTKAVVDEDGWFHTGDIGEILPEGHLKITGRKKEIFKTSLGKYISPELIENKFKESPFIDTLVVLGENQKFAAALVVPDFIFLGNYCKIKDIPCNSYKEIVNNPIIKKRFDQEIKKYNHHFGATEQIKRYQLVGEEFTIESGELTPSLKLRRDYISKKYSLEIEKLFS